MTITAGQAAGLKVMIEEIIARPQEDVALLAWYVVADWYRRNAARFVFIPEQLRLTFTPAQAYALNMLLLQSNFDCDAARVLARNIIGLIDPKL
jgi:hypothetical protein